MCGGDAPSPNLDLAITRYERSRAWLELLDQKDLDWINSQVDRRLMWAFGIEPVIQHPRKASALFREHQARKHSSGIVTAQELNETEFERKRWHSEMLTFLD